MKSPTGWEIIVIQGDIQMFLMVIYRYEEPDHEMILKMAHNVWSTAPERAGDFDYSAEWKYVLQKHTPRRAA